MKKNIIILISGIFFAAVAATGFGFFVSNAVKNASARTTMQSQALTDVSESKFVDMSDPKVLGVETTKTDALLASEHYKVKQISFGGDVAVAIGNNKNNLEISDVRSELLMTKDQKEFRFLISWKTNKLATSEIEYTKAGSQARTLKEKGFGLSHSVVLSQLEMSSAYTYTIKTTDQWGNSITSDRYAMYTSSRALSVFDLIAKEFSGMFAWASK
ncbi:MAG: hypothetical protein HGA36_02820 [Candidatus Moranbacteria bacterium]|nr:hypothetical protein [Candidatus Moranbacteria bacterium]